MKKRRDFLKLLAASTGGLFLSSGCGSAGGGDGGSTAGFPAPPAPTGYRFFSLLDTGQQLPDNRTLQALLGGVTISDAGAITLYGQTAQGMGIYEVRPDLAALEFKNRNRLASARKVVSEGDLLAGGRSVKGLGNLATNARGSLALSVQDSEGLQNLLFAAPQGPLTQLATFGTRLPGSDITFAGTFRDLDLNDDDDLLTVEQFTRAGQTAPQQGLFLLRQGRLDERTRLLNSTQDPLPDASGPTVGFGLVDLNSAGQYVAHVIGPLGGALPPQGVLTGNSQDPLSARLVAAPSSFRVSARGVLGRVTSGSVIHGPRLAHRSSTLACVVYQSDQEHAVFVNDQKVWGMGERSPGGSVVRGFATPVLRSDGALYGVAITDDGHELLQQGPTGPRLLLARGDSIEGRPVNSIIFGFHSDQVDSQGRLVFIAEFMDGASSLVLGLPV